MSHGIPNFDTNKSNTEQASDDLGSSASEGQDVDRSKWIRLVFMVLFLLVFGLVEAILYIISIVGFVAVLINGKPIDELVRFGEKLSEYSRAIIRFLTYNTEHLPWPLN